MESVSVPYQLHLPFPQGPGEVRPSGFVEVARRIAAAGVGLASKGAGRPARAADPHAPNSGWVPSGGGGGTSTPRILKILRTRRGKIPGTRGVTRGAIRGTFPGRIVSGPPSLREAKSRTP